MSTSYGGRFGCRNALRREILRDNPRGYWIMDEASGATCADETGNGYDLTFSGSEGSAYRRAECMLLGDESTYPKFLTTTSRAERTLAAGGFGGIALPYTGDFTVEAVAMLADPNTTNPRKFFQLVGNGASEVLAENYQVLFAVDGTGNPYVLWEYGAGTNTSLIDTAVDIPPARPMHFAVTRDSTARFVRYFVNGALRSTFTYTAGQVPTGGTNARPVIGDDGNPADVIMIGHVAFYESRLTPARIRSHFEATGLPWNL